MAGDPEADQFVVVKYPAIAEEDEYLDHDTDLIARGTAPEHGALLRLKGEALHPERYDLDKLNQIKRTISPRFWSALYQQNPVPDDGAYFLKEHFRRAPHPHISRCNVYIAWDFAISEKKTNDYTVGTVILQDEDDVLHVAEQVRFKSGDAFFIVEAILNLSKKWYTSGQQLGFEDGQIYRALESLLKKRMKERQQYPSITVLKPITDKLARARPLQGRMQQGVVSFNVADDGWYDTCRLEMLRFPAGTHDDCVDSVSWATQMAIGRAPPRKIQHKEPESWVKKLNLGGGRGSFMAA
jgi:predicted phage terminase large subunit-like protein